MIADSILPIHLVASIGVDDTRCLYLIAKQEILNHLLGNYEVIDKFLTRQASVMDCCLNVLPVCIP